MIWPLWALGALGVVLLLLTAYDLVVTTLGVARGAGPVTGRVADLTWRALRGTSRLARRGHHHEYLASSGIAVLVVTTLLWVSGLWTGWTLVFLTAGDGIAPTSGAGSAGVVDRAYFAGYNLVTLGLGDVVPTEGGWQVVTVVCASTGLLLFTTGVTYLLSVIQASTRRRATASVLHALGGSAAGIVRMAWTGTDFRGLDPHLPSLCADVSDLKQHQLAYPVVHYLHAPSAINGAPARVAALSDALDVLRLVDGDRAPAHHAIEPTRQVLGHLVDTLGVQYVHPTDAPPPLPDLAHLRAEGIPVPDEATLAAGFAERAEHRSVLAGWVTHDGWDWVAAVCLEDRDTADGPVGGADRATQGTGVGAGR